MNDVKTWWRNTPRRRPPTCSANSPPHRGRGTGSWLARRGVRRRDERWLTPPATSLTPHPCGTAACRYNRVSQDTAGRSATGTVGTTGHADVRTNSGWRRDDVVHPGRWPTRCLSLWRWAVFRIGEGEQRPTSIKYSRPEHCPAPRRQPGKEASGDEAAHHQPDRDALLLGNRCGGGREGHKKAGYPRALRRGQPASGSNVRTCRRWGVPVVPMSGYQVR